jgi:hypothetical protein
VKQNVFQSYLFGQYLPRKNAVTVILPGRTDDDDDGGLFVFTSSGSVYAENSGGTVDESSELARNPRSGKIIDAEQAALAKVRLQLGSWLAGSVR